MWTGIELFLPQRLAAVRIVSRDDLLRPCRGSADVRNSRLSQMTGELWPTPGSGCFQRKLAGFPFGGNARRRRFGRRRWGRGSDPSSRRGKLDAQCIDTSSNKIVSRKGAEAQKKLFNHEGTKTRRWI